MKIGVFATFLSPLADPKMILEFGNSKAFEPFDRWGHEREIQGKSLAELLDEFARVRAAALPLGGAGLRRGSLGRHGFRNQNGARPRRRPYVGRASARPSSRRESSACARAALRISITGCSPMPSARP